MTNDCTGEINETEFVDHHKRQLLSNTNMLDKTISFLINNKHIDNKLTKNIQDTISKLKEQVVSFNDDPWNGSCPHNDPTLDPKDPYYMRPGTGNSPEELARFVDAERHASGSETLMGCIRQSTNNPLNKKQNDN
jgi:hypothetical protein